VSFKSIFSHGLICKLIPKKVVFRIGFGSKTGFKTSFEPKPFWPKNKLDLERKERKKESDVDSKSNPCI